MTEHGFFIALCLWREARNQPREAIQAVYSVIRNRMADPRWPKTGAGVVLQPRQFSCFNANDPQAGKFPRVDAVGELEQPFLDCLAIVTADAPDNTGGANHYHDASIQPPYKAWLGVQATAADLRAKQTASYGALRFYKI